MILFDDLVSREVLDFARREANKLLVGKTGFGTSCKQNDINTLMAGLAKHGKRVVRLKSGYPAATAPARQPVASSALPPLQDHRQTVARPDRDQALRLDRMAGLEAQAIALGDRRQDQRAFRHGERRADADARAGAERQVGEARTCRRSLC